MRLLVMAAMAALLAACATATPYQASMGQAGYGFTEQAIESNRLRITFRGNTLTDRDTVETYLLYRAAELTVERGFDHFIIADRGTDADRRLQGVGSNLHRYPFGYRYFHPAWGWSPWYDPFWDAPDSYREVTRYEAAAEIAMFRGAKPADNPNAFDARDVMSNLAARIARPAPAR
jgi:hypothetical protein